MIYYFLQMLVKVMMDNAMANSKRVCLVHIVEK
jgi:hypothetical protein